MARRVWTVARVEEIQRLIGEGLSDRQISQTLHCRRSRVKEVRELGSDAARVIAAPRPASEPAWASGVVWPAVLDEIGRGFEIKRVWEERAAQVTTYSNFWKYLDRRYPALLKETVTLREFDPGTHCEVDWAGDRIPWWDRSGHRHEAHVFVGILCHSQLLFAWASESERKTHWLTAHQRMFESFAGVPRVVVPDNLKAGVLRSHLYDPDLNPGYTELARHYGTAIVPARVRRPRDKSLVENGVGLVMRLLRFVYRHHRFHSLAEINEALGAITERINTRPHSRFRISRKEKFERFERQALRPLPSEPFEQIEWRRAKIHPDGTVAIEAAYYSVPFLHRGKEVRAKLTARQVEIFVGMERVALHARDRARSGHRVIDSSHLPPNAAAYRETTPQFLLSQARFISPDLHQFIDELFQADSLGNLRRAQGLIRHAREEITRFGRQEATTRVAHAIEQMRRFNQPRVTYFSEQLTRLRRRTENPDSQACREISRRPGNPMLRNLPQAGAASTNTGVNLQLLPESSGPRS
jgi:hypothetical protein